jgi:hypothetical protein
VCLPSASSARRRARDHRQVTTADLTVIGLGRSDLKLDERRDKEQTLEDKVRSVEERLQEDE